ncbi:hypothetical protein A9Q84_01475 [Halobacteriovorax marinus]|uniref:Uncharacterized protein n=1 Tax=Halobacteriovorax marinus TaxID=97084 RepID=A0A1Y5FC00_9BACT|nr:hypothetical protein A9Q84_01475 [Halobacteriovorax marinus]
MFFSSLGDQLKILTLLVSLLITTTTLAREVDQYMAWGHTLSDSGPVIDQYIRDGLKKAIVEINTKKYHYVTKRRRGTRRRIKVETNWYKSCTLVAHKVMREAFYSPTYQKIEDFVDNDPSLDRYPRRPSTKDKELRKKLKETPNFGFMTDKEYLKRSIVRTSPLNSPLARIVNVYGIYSGADKFGHFTSFGVRYLKKIHKKMKKGLSYEQALKKVFNYGYTSEKSYVGMLFTKVFSRGDLEANYQGLVFSKSLCDSSSTFRLENNGKSWSFKNLNQFSIRNYINPNWDESHNNSLFTAKKWNKAVIPTVLENKYCEKLDSNWVRELKERYITLEKKSLNKEFEGAWIKKKFDSFDPKTHSLIELCSKIK